MRNLPKRVTQQDIADVLEIDRTTVTKILNRDPGYSASLDTKNLVFLTAERLGYNFKTIRRPFKRTHDRAEHSFKTEIEIKLNDGTHFDTGTATIRNISIGGALLDKIITTKSVLPLNKFIIAIHFKSPEVLSGISIDSKLVRYHEVSDSDSPEIAVRFQNLSETAVEQIDDFIAEEYSKARKIQKKKAIQKAKDLGLPKTPKEKANKKRASILIGEKLENGTKSKG